MAEPDAQIRADRVAQARLRAKRLAQWSFAGTLLLTLTIVAGLATGARSWYFLLVPAATSLVSLGYWMVYRRA